MSQALRHASGITGNHGCRPATDDTNPNSFNSEGKLTMKTSMLVAAITACAVSAPFASAQQTPEPAKPAMGKGMNMAMNTDMDMEKRMSQMQENMTRMQQQMEKVQATTDPKERQALMQEHMQAMQDTMKTMRGMGGPMMAGKSPGEPMAMGKGKAMGGSEMMKRHAMTEKRVDMMEMMMEQMMQHDRMMESMPAK